MKKATVLVALAFCLGLAFYESRRASKSEAELQMLRLQSASLAVSRQPQESKRADAEPGGGRSEPPATAASAVNPELLRLRGEVGRLRQELTATEAKAQASTNRSLFTQPIISRSDWSDHGTGSPKDTILSMFGALRQGDQGKLEQIVLPMRDSQTMDNLALPKKEWDKLSAIQVVKTTVTSMQNAGKVTAETATVDVFVEKTLDDAGVDKDVDTYRWTLTKENGRWLIRGRD